MLKKKLKVCQSYKKKNNFLKMLNKKRKVCHLWPGEENYYVFN